MDFGRARRRRHGSAPLTPVGITMPTKSKVLVNDKTGFTPAGKKPKGEGQGRDDTDQDVSTEPEIRRQSNLDSTTPFLLHSSLLIDHLL
eukprot:scaffold1767_cov131-Skeletonema_menzelii.AAC.2